MKDDKGFVLVTVLMVMMVLTIIATTATNTTNIELMIAGNDKVATQTFFEADGGAQISIEIIEENIACSTGFTNSTIGDTADDNDHLVMLTIDDKKLWQDKNTLPTPPVSDSSKKFHYPDNTSVPHTNVNTKATVELATGSAIQMVAGYEGKGKAAAQGGGIRKYDIYAQRLGAVNSESIVHEKWRHMIGQEANCIY